MSVRIQVSNMPLPLWRRLKSHAASLGKQPWELVVVAIREYLERRPPAELAGETQAAMRAEGADV